MEAVRRERIAIEYGPEIRALGRSPVSCTRSVWTFAEYSLPHMNPICVSAQGLWRRRIDIRFDHIECAVDDDPKQIAGLLFPEFLAQDGRVLRLLLTAEAHQPDRVAVLVFLGAEHAANGKSDGRRRTFQGAGRHLLDH